MIYPRKPHVSQGSELGDTDLTNEDLAPIPLERRTWSMWNIAALWVGMSVCIPTYMLASSLITGRHELVAGDPHCLSR
jgi:cytosine/uracil/thiamine/allantoin permease